MNQNFNLESILGSAEKEKKTKSKVQEVNLSLEHKVKVDKMIELKTNITNNETELDLLFQEILSILEKERNNLIAKNGYFSSIKVSGTNGGNIIVSWKDKYSKIPIQNYDDLKALFDGNLDSYFAKKMTITVKQEISENDLIELISLIGAERFAKYFEVERWIEPTSKFTYEKHLLDENIKNKVELIVKQHKPSLKI